MFRDAGAVTGNSFDQCTLSDRCVAPHVGTLVIRGAADRLDGGAPCAFLILGEPIEAFPAAGLRTGPAALRRPGDGDFCGNGGGMFGQRFRRHGRAVHFLTGKAGAVLADDAVIGTLDAAPRNLSAGVLHAVLAFITTVGLGQTFHAAAAFRIAKQILGSTRIRSAYIPPPRITYRRRSVSTGAAGCENRRRCECKKAGAETWSRPRERGRGFHGVLLTGPHWVGLREGCGQMGDQRPLGKRGWGKMNGKAVEKRARSIFLGLPNRSSKDDLSASEAQVVGDGLGGEVFRCVRWHERHFQRRP